MERAIDRAIAGVKDLMKAELRTIGAELQAINQRLSRVDTLEERVSGLDSRVTAAEAFVRSQEKRLGESRAYRKVNLPTLVLTTVAVIVAVVSGIVVPLLLS